MYRRRRKPETVCGMEVHGTGDFRTCTREALALLEPLAQFEVIQAHLSTICEGKRSGITAWAEHPVFTVGAPTWNHSPLWYAGAIAHDAYHAKLYRDAKRLHPDKKPPVNAWSGKAAERTCLAFQRDVLLSLQADKTLLEYIEKHLLNPTYQGRSKGRGGWLDYRKRWW
jgi:hypothetical protein